MVMSTGARRRRSIRAIRRAQVNPVKPLPTITIEVTNPSVGRLAGWVEIVQCTVANIARGRPGRCCGVKALRDGAMKVVLKP